MLSVTFKTVWVDWNGVWIPNIFGRTNQIPIKLFAIQNELLIQLYLLIGLNVVDGIVVGSFLSVVEIVLVMLSGIKIFYIITYILHKINYLDILHEQYIFFLKVASEEIIPLPCKCSILLGLTFVEIKNSFTKNTFSF